MNGLQNNQNESEFVQNVNPPIGIEKECKQCGKIKKIESFHKEKRVRDGLAAICINREKGDKLSKPFQPSLLV